MNKLTLVLFEYSSTQSNLTASYLSYGLKKEKIPFILKRYPVNKKSNLTLKIKSLYDFFASSSRILAVGCWSDVLPFVLVVLEKLKKNFPEKLIILGGIGPSSSAAEIMTHFPSIDFIIKGCGIESLPKLIKKIQAGDDDFNDIKGLLYRKDGNALTTNPTSFYSESLIDVAIPYHQLENINRFNKFNINTSFGCPFSCTFCQMPSLSNRKIIYRNLYKVIEEIEFISKMSRNKKPTILINDEGFVVNKKRVQEFFRIVKHNRLNLDFACYGRVNCVDEPLLATMAEAGLKKIYYGVESGSNRTLKTIKKGFEIEEAVKILLLSKKYIKSITASFIFLYPFESIKDVKATISVMKFLYSKGIYVQLHQIVPILNSEIYLEYKKKIHLFKSMRTTFHMAVEEMPKECIDVIKKYPEIFHYYYSYRYRGFMKTLRLIYSQIPFIYKKEKRLEM